MKLPLPTTVSTVPPSASLITVKSTGTIVRASARSLPTLTAGTERRQYPLVRVTPVVLITPIVRPKSAAGLAIPDIHNQEARALKTTPVTTVRRLFQVVQETQAALTSQIVRPKSVPGLVTQDIKSQEARALKTILLVLRITVQKVPGFLDAPAMIPAQAAEGVIISVIFAGETEQEHLAAAAVRIKARWALTPVDKLSDFQKTKGNHKQAPRLRGLLL